MPITTIIFIVSLACYLCCTAFVILKVARISPQEGEALFLESSNKVSVDKVVYVANKSKLKKINLGLKRLYINRLGESGVRCKDYIKADMVVSFFTRINNTETDVRNVIQELGHDQLDDTNYLIRILSNRLNSVIENTTKQYDFVELYENISHFAEDLRLAANMALEGFYVEEVVINQLDQTALQYLNPQNIFDALGIQKVTQITQNARKITLELKREHKLQLANLSLNLNQNERT